MFRKTYDWVMGLAGSRHASKALAAVSFAESSIFPIPPDVMLAPMILARPQKAYFYAANAQPVGKVNAIESELTRVEIIDKNGEVVGVI